MSAMAIKPKSKSERFGRRKETLLKKAHEIAKFCEVDLALILRIRKAGRYITYQLYRSRVLAALEGTSSKYSLRFKGFAVLKEY
jgi:hypothetical protein